MAVKPIKYGLNGSRKANVEAIPPKPPNTARTGVIQHREAAIVANNPAPIHFFSDAVFVSITYALH